MEPLYRSASGVRVSNPSPCGLSNAEFALSIAEVTLNSLRSVLATNAAGEALVEVATRAAKAELEMYRLNEKARAMGYVSIHAALHELSKSGEGAK